MALFQVIVYPIPLTEFKGECIEFSGRQDKE